MLRKKKICNTCGKECFLFSHGRCEYCAKKDYASKSTKIIEKRKPTGELAIFKAIWDSTRKKVSVVSGKPIYKFHISCFAHVLAKGKHPKLRLLPENIVYLTPEEHFLYDQGTEEQRKKYPDDWEKLYRYREELKAKYHK